MILTVTLNPALDDLVLVDHFRLHAKNFARSRRTFPGGKGFNVAKALAAQGQPVTALGFAGRADLDFYNRRLQSAGIRPALVPIAHTRTNLKIIETGAGQETEINEPGADVEHAEVDALLALFDAELAGATWLVVAGSAAPGVPDDLCADLIRRAAARGIPSLVDASGAILREAIRAGPRSVRINRQELSEWSDRTLGSQAEIIAAVRSLLEAGAGQAVISMGTSGALLVEGNEQWLARPPLLHAVNAVGAGDAMSAGLIGAWQRELAPPDDLRWATAAAAASVLTLEPGVLDVEEAQRLLERVEILAV